MSQESNPTPENRPVRLAPSPHLADTLFTTRRMMIEVLIGLVPVMVMAVVVFGWYAVVQVGICMLCCVATEAIAAWMRGKPSTVGDYSAAVTGIILGLSLPWSAPWYVAVIGSVVAIGLGKAVFGGLGYNIFNPAMVGRAFVMLSFAKELGASAYQVIDAQLPVLTQATPLTVAKQFAGQLQVQAESAPGLWALLIGQVNGSLGETSALALALGGLYLCVRRVASWEIPLGIFVTAFLFVALTHWSNLTPFTPLQHLIAGSLMFGAFFIATDPVTSPLTPWGKFLFGVGIGALVVVIRVFSGYPEGVMFAVLLMNAAVPLINRWTIPRPFGGPVPAS
jgi:electron transport complex protein RnfD